LLVSTLGMSIPSFLAPFICLLIWLCIAKIYTPEHDGKLVWSRRFWWRKLYNGKYYFTSRGFVNSSLGSGNPIDVTPYLETFGQDYIRTARAKGLSEYQIIRKLPLKLIKPCRNCNFRMVCLDACRCSICWIFFGWNGLGKNSGRTI
jgi:peptide/nickel transport system permease protein